MQAVAVSGWMLALSGLGQGEIVLILAVVLILFGARRLPELGRGLSVGLFEFRRATREVTDEIDEAASEAGRSVGGIYGRPAAEALTPDNHVAELYDPAVLQGDPKLRKRWKVPGFMRFCGWIGRLFQAISRVLGRR
jgi:sec-independent protein translocase protein TatA